MENVSRKRTPTLRQQVNFHEGHASRAADTRDAKGVGAGFQSKHEGAVLAAGGEREGEGGGTAEFTNWPEWVCG